MRRDTDSLWIHLLMTSVLVLLALGFACSRQGKDQTVPLKTEVDGQELIASLESRIPELMDEAMIPGLSIAVVRDGEILWSKGFGVKNVDTGEPVTEETVFEAASLSKPVFAYAVLKMVERGKLDLDRPLLEFVTDSYIQEDFLGREIDDERFRKITARMVLSHSCGFPNWRGRSPLTIQFEPGEKFSYSGEGFGCLQRVVEKIEGLSLNEFMKKELFDPLCMKNSSYVWQTSYDQSASSPHNMMAEVRRKGKPTHGHGAATLHTTAPDFARFLMAIMNHTGLAEGIIDSMLTPQVVVDPEDSEDVCWGLGIGLERTADGIAFWHWGDNENFRCFAVGFPNQRIGVVYFTNSFYGLSIREQVVRLAIGGEHPVLTSSLLDDYGDVDSPGMEFTRTLVKVSVDSAIARYRQLRETVPPEKIMPEYAMNAIGYGLLRSDAVNVKDAIEIFKLNVEAYPDAYNTYDSLGEAYMVNGDIELAIENYEKSLELNPDNTNAVERLKKLEEL